MKKEGVKNKNGGFTLIEMLVSIAIFTVIIVLGMTATLSMINANRKSQSSTLILSNLSLAIESMTKNIRVGTEYSVDTPTAIRFTPSSGEGWIEYRLDDINDDGKNEIVRQTNTEDVSAVTAPEVDINQVKFVLRNTADNEQPQVLMLVEGKAGGKEGTQSQFYLQSLISQRLITLPLE